MLRFRGVHPRSAEEISLHTEAAGPAPPDAFGPFRVLHQIGAGALGPVFRAYDPDQDKLVAVKLFRVDLPPERAHELVADFERLIAADLTHSSIVAAVATGMVQVSPYLAQDFVAADSLDTVLREHGPAPPSEGLRIVTQIAGGLDFAAVVGIVHGALHPRDVLISPDEVRLTGIGVARALERVGFQPPVRRPYAAPERVAGDAWDRRADVFTLAALAHEVLWGRRVTAAGDEAAAILDEIPGASLNRLRGVFARALSEKPGARFPTALEFADALKNCFTDRKEERPIPAPPAVDYPRLPIDDLPARPEPAITVAHAPQLRLLAEEKPAEPQAVEPQPAPKAPEPRIAESPPPATIVDEPEPVPPLTAREVADDREYIDIKVVESKVEPLADLALQASEPTSPPEPALADTADREREAAAAAAIATHAELPVRIEPPARIEHPINLGSQESFSPARSAVWPLSLALIVGLALGFAGGYWLGQSDQRREQLEASAGRSTTAETEVPLKIDPAADGREGAPGASRSIEAALPPNTPAATAPRSDAPPPAAAPKPVPPPAEAAPAAVRPVTPPPAAETSKSAETSSVARTGRITVRSTPAGARVTIDGKDVGKTPLTIPNLTRGTHTVRVIRDGYSTVERRVVITPTQPTSTLTLNLARAAAPSAARPPAPPAPDPETRAQTASLFIDSRPSGATVSVDGKRVGTTPLSLPSIGIGAHAVRMEMTGYKPWSASVRVVAGEKNRVAASLEQ